ncbi:MAG: hypothetical protein E7177_04875 [Erysipelotrichaceae bacterium]|nr:hypothetical protein [Erysipelotrichaceae bacterium]
MEINEIKHGFKLVSINYVEDINSNLYQYEHIKSGGRVVHIQNDDPHCTFAIGFRTLPKDSTGVCHIIEHSLLCGSKKYPLKEPFVNLLKSSLATFLNAFTAYDWTMYPFSSQVPQDFDNILSIYLDAVFNPISMIDKKPFLQEGWHLELLNKEDLPVIKGVVYNEMKGATSSVDDVLESTVNEIMYKDTIYRHNSGGDPEVIPELTYEDYVSFYKEHYTPQNALTFFYGDMDIEKKLKYLNEEYFSSFTKSEKDIVIDPQTPHINTTYKKEYEVGKDEDIKDKTYVGLCYSLGSYENYEDICAMSLIFNSIMSNNDSPLKKSILDKKFGKNVRYSIDDNNVVPSLHIDLLETDSSKKEEFKLFFEEQIRKLVNEGIDRELLTSTLNFSEFKDKERNLTSSNKGLNYALSIIGPFIYRSSLINRLEFTSINKSLREKLQTSYYEDLLDKYILKSNHYVLVEVNPSKTLGDERKAKVLKQMKEIKDKMSNKEIDALIKQTRELIAYQNKVDTKKELDTLPKLSIKDIPSRIDYLDTKKTSIKGMKTIYHNVPTNKIGYLRMYFSLDCVELEDFPYVRLLRSLLLNVKTKSYTPYELMKNIKTNLGSFVLSIANNPINRYETRIDFTLATSALLENIKYIPNIINEVLLTSKFTKNEVKTILNQTVMGLRQSLIENGNSHAIMEARSAYSSFANYENHYKTGIGVYNFFKDLLDNFDYKKINEKLVFISKKIFSKNNVTISLSGDEETIQALKEECRNLKFRKVSIEKVLKPNFNEPKKEALVVPSGVSYNVIASNLEEIGHVFSGKDVVLSHILSYDYLWNEIRVKGGAYGAGFALTKINDTFFYSYRDPNVKNSYDVYRNIINYLDEFNPSKKEFINYVIGAVGGISTPNSIVQLIDQWDINYLINVTKKDKIKLKKEALKTTLKDIKDYKKVFTYMMSSNSEYTVGEENKINEYPFNKVNKL